MTESAFKRYRIWCVTEGISVYTWASTEPTTCPNNAGHTITTSKTALIDRLRSLNVRRYDADTLETPNSADWAVNALAPTSADGLNAGITVARFDDTAEEGRGVRIYIHPESTRLSLIIYSRAETAPGAARTVGLKLYYRQITDNTAVGAWNSKVLTDVDIPTNTNFQQDTYFYDLGADFSPVITPGGTYQFELTRINPTGGVELTGDWDLYLMDVITF